MQNISTFLRDHIAEECEAPSHTSMVGGKWVIPKAEDDQFLEHYLDSLSQGGAHHFSELILPGCAFYFFLDLDLPSAETVEQILLHNGLASEVEFYRSLVRLSVQVVSSITENNIDVIFSKKRTQTHKIHLNFPTVLCDRKEVAVEAIREIQRLFVDTFDTEGCPELRLNWTKVFDSKPYSGGLRMIGSRKTLMDGPDAAYEVFNLDTEEYEPLTLDVLRRTSIRSEVRSSLQPAAGVQYAGGGGAIPFAAIRDYMSHLRTERTFGDLPLSFYRVKAMFNGFVVDLNDRLCPFKRDTHRRTSRVLYLYISPAGCRLKCRSPRCEATPSALQPLTVAMRQVFDGFAPESLQVTAQEQRFFEKFGMRLRISDETRGLMKALGSSDLQIAQVFDSVFRERFCVAECGKDQQWYVFLGHRFHPGNMDAKLALMYVVRTLYKLFIHEKYPDVYRSDTVTDMNVPDAMEVEEDEGDEEEAGGMEAGDRNLERIKKFRVKQVAVVVNRLESLKSIGSILSTAGILFQERYPDVANKMDSARHLMAFSNGVLDFSVPSQPIFREGRYSDFITLCSSVDFKFYSIDDPILAEVNNFFVSLFPKVEIREYVLMVLSKCLTASEVERLYILTGSGSNGKTKLVKLIMRAFGDYWRDMNVSVLTQKRKSSNAASPELVDMKGRHIITTQEPDADDRLNSGVVKQATGGDPISVRQLYGAQQVIYPKATIFLCCNDVPAANSCDGGMARRQRVIPLEQKFVTDPNPNRPHEQKIDDDLDQKINGWGSAFCYLLYLYRREYTSPQIEECDAVVRYTLELARETDPFYAFESEFLVPLAAEEDGNPHFYSTFEKLWGLYETFCGVHKHKKVGQHSLRRRLHEKYGVEKIGEIDYVLVRTVGEQVPMEDVI